MKLFTVGPVSMDKETLAVRSEQIPYFRTNEFSELKYGKRFKRFDGYISRFKSNFYYRFW